MKQFLLLLTLSLSITAQVGAPSLSELERTRLELLATKRQNLELQAAAIQEAQRKLDDEIRIFIETVKAKYPGYQLGANGQLEKIPEPKK